MSADNHNLSIEIIEGEILAIAPGTDDANGQPGLVITIGPKANKEPKTIDLTFSPEDVMTAAEKIQVALLRAIVDTVYSATRSQTK
jgi:hypothetical protein